MGRALKQACLLVSSAQRIDASEPVTVKGPMNIVLKLLGTTNLVTQPLTTTNRFYRLRWP